MNDSCHATVTALLRELADDRLDRLSGARSNRESKDLTGAALCADLPESVAHDIAFHLLDWNAEAAFLLALHLFPERFTPEQIREGVEAFLNHAPNHVAAAAKLSGRAIADIFELGALDGPEEDGPDLLHPEPAP